MPASVVRGREKLPLTRLGTMLVDVNFFNFLNKLLLVDVLQGLVP